MLFVCYPNCSTCQKALAFLQAHGVQPTIRNIKTERPTAAELRAWLALSGRESRALFNTSGLVYKALRLKDKLPEMEEQARFDLLATDGMLVRRPLLIGDDFALIGFRAAEWEQALQK